MKSPLSAIPPLLFHRMLKQKYQLFGKQTAVKKCNWTHNALRRRKFCYKQHYGILSHRCIQATPTLICNHQCAFCWRTQERDLGLAPLYNVLESQLHREETLPQLFDLPEEVMGHLLKGWRRIISGYKPFTPSKMFEESMYHPRHVTLSLAGEPFLYPWYSELVRLFLERNFSVFTVSNGTVPERIEEMRNKKVYPDQLYITLPGPSEEVYLRTCQPLLRDGWRRILSTLELIGEGIDTRTVARLTVAAGYNLTDAAGYAKLIELMKPSFVEVKGVVHVGAAQQRISRSAMPDHAKIERFSQEIAQETGYEIAADSTASKLVILTNHTKPLIIDRLRADLRRYEEYLDGDIGARDTNQEST